MDLVQEQLEATQAQLEWERRGTDLNGELLRSAADSSEEDTVYDLILRLALSELPWEVGHVLKVADGERPALCPTSAWGATSAAGFQAFHEETIRGTFAPGQDLPGRALATGKVEWSTDLATVSGSQRGDSLKMIPPLSAIAIPIAVEGKVVAVLEFCSRALLGATGDLNRVFEVVALQASMLVSSKRACLREEQHRGILASAARLVTIGEITAGVGHEIKNPLSSIALTTEVLKRMVQGGVRDTGTLLEQIERLESSIARANRIVTDLQSISRDASNDPFAPEKVSDIIAETVGLCSARLRRSRIELLVPAIPSEWSTECRSSQVSQVLLNLISNSHDAIEGSQGAWIRMEVSEGEDAYEISVIDSGHGVAPEVAAKMMTGFFTTKPPGKGTGLGLSISRELMRSHGGDLRYETGARNTTFVARIPKRQGGVRSASNAAEHA